MKINDSDITRIIDASMNTVFRTLVEDAVSRRFKSMHYASSRLVCYCVMLNLIYNKDISPSSADELISAVRRREKSLYTTIESAYFPIRDDFEEYAKTVLGDELAALDMRPANFIVYVISKDLRADKRINAREIIDKAYTFAEIKSGNYPHG